MKVVKRDGRIQDFDINKILLTIEKVGDEIAEPFTESDLEHLAEDIESEIESRGSDSIAVEEIQDIVTKHIEEFGFKDAARHYREYRKTL